MDNAQVAGAFAELAARMALTEKTPYRVLAYQRAAETIRQAPVSVATLAAEDRLRELEGVGDAIADKIAQLLATGTFDALERARSQVPDGLLELTRVPGVGAKTAQRIWRELDAATFAEVAAAARDGRLAALAGVGAKTAGAVLDHERLLDERDGHASAGRDEGPLLLRDEARAVEDAVIAMLGATVQVDRGGELARGAEQVRTIRVAACCDDPTTTRAGLLAAAHAAGWTATDADAPRDTHLVAANGAHVHVATCTPAEREQVRIEVIGPPAFAARASAADAARIPPELRELPGVLDDPTLVPDDLLCEADLHAELHCHSDWSDGHATIAQMAAAALARGDRILAITDHSAPYAMVNGLDDARLAAQRDEIDRVNADLGGELVVLHGSEVEILPDGSLGLADHTLRRLDWVIASIHTSQRQAGEVILERMRRVLDNPLVDCVGHASSRILGRRDPTALDIPRLLEHAATTGTLFEINAAPQRLDLSAHNARIALGLGLAIAINTDAHRPHTLANRGHGVAVARRAGARRGQVANCVADVDALMALRPRNRA